MRAGKLLRHVRLLPAVMTLAAALLVIKGEGLIDARAQDGKDVRPGVARPANPDPAGEDAEQGSASTVDVLTSLAHRRSELDVREGELSTRENLIAAAAKRVDQRIAELKALQAKLQSLLGQRDAAEQKQFDQLVKSYSSMKPKDAARIFNALSDEVLVPVAAAMKADVLGAILAQMQPEAAQKLTVKLANRLNPQKIETEAAQVAATAASAAAAPPPPQTTQPAAASMPAPAPAQPDPMPAAPSPTPAPQQSADNSAPTPAPPQTAPGPTDGGKSAAKHRRRAKKLAMAQAAFTKPLSMQSVAPQTSPGAQPTNASARPPQPVPAPQTATTAAQHPAPATTAAPQTAQTAAQRTAQTLPMAQVGTTSATVPSQAAPSPQTGK